jgi:hypothetical protein
MDKWMRENDVEINIAAVRVLLALVPNGAFSPAFFTTPEDEVQTPLYLSYFLSFSLSLSLY